MDATVLPYVARLCQNHRYTPETSSSSERMDCNRSTYFSMNEFNVNFPQMAKAQLRAETQRIQRKPVKLSTSYG